MIIDGIEFELTGSLDRITIADSFVFPSNKTGKGNGEAKLYIGQNEPSLIDFWGGKRGFLATCFLRKDNLLDYLDSARNEYSAPTQEYRKKTEMRSLWYERKKRIENFTDDKIYFGIYDQDQLEGTRVYINSGSPAYKLIREICLPEISYLNIKKYVSPDGRQTDYYFELNISKIDEIDKEIENDIAKINVPFEPNRIKVRTTSSSIGQLIDDIEDDVINLDTEFQRLPNLWDNVKKSRFIESLLLKLPIPAFYFNEKEENDLEVIDGLQRISTLKDFVIDKNLKLTDLEFLKEYDNCSFDALPNLFQRRIKTFPITVYIIEKGTPDEVKYNIFKRVNTGGLILTPQEIRHAINNGDPSNLVADLVRGEDETDDEGNVKKRVNRNGEEILLTATPEGKAFVKVTDDKVGSFRMEDRDFATRFISFYLIPYQQYEPDLDTFLNNGMAKINEIKSDADRIIELKDDFRKSMELAFEIFGPDAFRKRFRPEDSRKPINKALFEVLSVNFAKLTDKEREIVNREQ